MQELIHFAVEPSNIVFTTLLIIIGLYWVSVLFGAMDLSSFDIELDTEVDVDVDVDMDADTDLETGSSGGWMLSALHFFNFGRMPFMLIMSTLILSLWALEILSNYYIGNGRIDIMLALFFPILLVSLIITKLATTPLVPLFANMEGGVGAIDYIGQECVLRLPASATNMGQASLNVNDNPIIINVKTEKDETVSKGSRAVITRADPENKFFYVKALIEEFI
ncbi:MAG: hypothetical protein MI974_31405 [Chitinophagales bacterium]|nr:hypothetical protein [Chitinophagales bacterium]